MLLPLMVAMAALVAFGPVSSSSSPLPPPPTVTGGGAAGAGAAAFIGAGTGTGAWRFFGGARAGASRYNQQPRGQRRGAGAAVMRGPSKGKGAQGGGAGESTKRMRCVVGWLGVHVGMFWGRSVHYRWTLLTPIGVYGTHI